MQISPEVNAKEKRLKMAGEKIKPIKNAFQVMGHGNPLFMRSVDENGNKIKGKNGEINSAKKFDERFDNNKEWAKGKTQKGFRLILYSCNTGRGGNSLACKLSKSYPKITVIAPTRQGWFSSSSGFVGIYDENNGEKETGYWIIYQGGKAVAAYDSTWEPGTSTKGHEVDLKSIPESHYNGSIGEKNYDKEKE